MPHDPTQAKRLARMEQVDAMTPDVRACVHEFGLSIVNAFLQAGVTKGRHIRHIVMCIRQGSYQSHSDGKAFRLQALAATQETPHDA